MGTTVKESSSEVKPSKKISTTSSASKSKSKLESFLESNASLTKTIEDTNSSKLESFLADNPLSQTNIPKQKPTADKILNFVNKIVSGTIIIGGLVGLAINVNSMLSRPVIPTYDQQEGVIFLGGNFKSMEVDVTATAQKNPKAVKSFYLLNGLTKSNGWYQVGLENSEKNGKATFNFKIDIFPNSSVVSNTGNDIVNKQIEFSKPITENDTIQLHLETMKNSVILSGRDLNNGAVASYIYTTNKPIGEFIGTSINGFFTGIMTEIYHSGKSNEIQETPVKYIYEKFQGKTEFAEYPFNDAFSVKLNYEENINAFVFKKGGGKAMNFKASNSNVKISEGNEVPFLGTTETIIFGKESAITN